MEIVPASTVPSISVIDHDDVELEPDGHEEEQDA